MALRMGCFQRLASLGSPPGLHFYCCTMYVFLFNFFLKYLILFLSIWNLLILAVSQLIFFISRIFAKKIFHNIRSIISGSGLLYYDI